MSCPQRRRHAAASAARLDADDAPHPPHALPAQRGSYRLALTRSLTRCKELHGNKRVMSVMDDGKLHTYTYRGAQTVLHLITMRRSLKCNTDFQQRVRRIANALIGMGVKEGDRCAHLLLCAYI